MKDAFYLEISDENLRRLEQAGVQFTKWRSGSILITGKNQLEAAAVTLNATVVKRGTVFNGPTAVKLVPIRVRAARATRRRQVRPADASSARAAAKARYVQACAARLGELRQTVRAVANPVLADLRKAELSFVDASRHLAFAERLTPEALCEKFRMELLLLRQTDKVVEIRPTTNGVMVYTDLLVATVSETTRREIGRFAIWIRFAGPNVGVTWINRTRRVDGIKKAMNAPYVYADGQPSHDDIRVSMFELLGRMELAAVADLAIQYVETISAEHALNAYIDNWPLATGVAAGSPNLHPNRSLAKTITGAISALLKWRNFRRVP